jgi:acyl-CoA synthetase (AMP-forming)/AMP-acid ligase II
MQADDWVTILEEKSDSHGAEVLYRVLGSSAKGLNAQQAVRTYAQLSQRAKSIAGVLQQLDAPHERLLLLYPHGLAFIDALFGAMYAGVCAIPFYLPHRSTQHSLEKIIADVGVTRVLTIEELLPTQAQKNAFSPRLAALPWLATDTLEDNPNNWQPRTVKGSDVAYLQYTSGSTGNPKGVEISHRNVHHNVQMIEQAFGHDSAVIHQHPGDFGVTWLPLYHDMGLVGHVFHPLYMGAASNFMAPSQFIRDPLSWLQAISDHGAHTSGGPNFAYELVLDKLTDKALSTLDLSRWKIAYCGAEPVRQKTLQRFSQRLAVAGFKASAFYPTYGLAEATLFVAGGQAGQPYRSLNVSQKGLDEGRLQSAQPEDRVVTSLVSCGQPRGDTVIRIVNPDHAQRLNEWEIGEIWLAGNGVARGYVNNPTATDAVFNGRIDQETAYFLKTGDLGALVDGELYVTGRLKDLIVLNGQNIYPQDLEAVVATVHPALNGVAVACSINTDEQETTLMLLEIRQRQVNEEEAQEIVDAVRLALLHQRQFRPQQMVLLPPRTIPHTRSGKCQRSQARALFESGDMPSLYIDQLAPDKDNDLPLLEQLRDMTLQQQKTQLKADLLALLAKLSGEPVDQLNQNLPFHALGLDSFQFFSVNSALQSCWGVQLSADRLLNSSLTLGQWLDYVINLALQVEQA